MKNKDLETQLQKVLFELTLALEDLIYNQGILSDDTISTIVVGTGNYTLDQQVSFYKGLLEISATIKTADEFIAKGQIIKEALIRPTD